MRILQTEEVGNVKGALISAGPAGWLMSWAAGEALDWLISGGAEQLMDSYGRAVEEGHGLPGSSGVAV